MRQTPHYKLPLFESSDQPKWLVDWNNAMAKIDLAIHTAETGDPDTPSISELYGMIQNLQNLVGQIKDDLTSDFDEDTNYRVNDFVFYEGDLYVCIEPYTAGDGWSTAFFQPLTFADKLSQALTDITSLDTRVTALEGGDTAIEAKTYSMSEFMQFLDYVGYTQNLGAHVVYDVYLDGKDIMVKMYAGCKLDNGNIVLADPVYADLPYFDGVAMANLVVNGNPLMSLLDLDDFVFVRGMDNLLNPWCEIRFNSLSYLPAFYIPNNYTPDYIGGDYDDKGAIPYIANAQSSPVSYGYKKFGGMKKYRARLTEPYNDGNLSFTTPPFAESKDIIVQSSYADPTKFTTNQLAKAETIIGLGIQSDLSPVGWGFRFKPFSDWSPQGISSINTAIGTSVIPDANGHCIWEEHRQTTAPAIYKVKAEYKDLFTN